MSKPYNRDQPIPQSEADYLTNRAAQLRAKDQTTAADICDRKLKAIKSAISEDGWTDKDC